MTAKQIIQQPINWRPNWSLIFTVVSFLFGFALNGFVGYMNNNSKLDVLNQEVSQLTAIVADMNKKIDSGNDRYQQIDKRVTVIETQNAVKK